MRHSHGGDCEGTVWEVLLYSGVWCQITAL